MKRLIGDGGARGPVHDHSGLRDLQLSFIEAGCPAPIGEDQRLGRSDYYFHGDPRTFINDVPHYYRLRYQNAWPNVDLVVRGWEGAIELSLSFRQGAKASDVRLQWTAGEPLEAQDGAVVVQAPWGAVKQLRPAGASWRIESNGAVRLA